jgi:4-hydroxyacetophenone monooxygenase
MDLEDAVARAHLPSLLAALADATGDLSLLRDELRPDPDHAREPNGGLTPAQRAAARRLAVDVIERRGDGGVPPADMDQARVLEIAAFLIGGPVPGEYTELFLEELEVPARDLRAPTWHKDALDPGRDLTVAVIGAGMSGLLAAHRLREAGVRCVVLEKNDDVGGTWLENHYPGCRVDVPSHLYSYSFAARDDWPQHFSPQSELLDYFRGCADDLGLRESIRSGTEVVAARFREADARWELTLRPAGGPEETITVDAVVSAVGQLNRPRLPHIPGRDTFAGPSFHSARWDDEVDLSGARVAVVGTGASAIQLIPAIAETAAQVDVYQRTPNWFMPFADYHAAVPDGTRWLMGNVPRYGLWYRFSLFWRLTEGFLPAAHVDPGWDGDGSSVGAYNDLLRQMLTGYLTSQFADSPELMEQVLPRYPPLAKRILLDDGTWARTLRRPNVELITDPIDQIEPSGVRCNGRVRPVDVIVYATGFEASHFLAPIRIVGRHGVDLHEHWQGEPRAYLGVTVPGFPNMFCLYGPNTNLVANGSIIFFSECGVRYVLGCLRLLVATGARALDCKPDVCDRYNERVDEANAQRAWGASSVNSWYKNEHGRVTQNWPFSLLEYWQRTREPVASDFELL